ncbi:hypothetical protein Psesu_0860 [Pseudoxanthomonas suwonensis 11-1]|uniref:Uncharacterized protein n=1 Tax=Pseudoxanthomonas suwonensis (strain 11-1) TaxID=743721 RepID=E6WRI1_PSEUU|nr:hypothetical protein [Pseudoxanthomonas suwonensis]ADV26712.1 hypothetical protein Psesu_0860 [Pseudoxanthomonas suwonensis 11-1]
MTGQPRNGRIFPSRTGTALSRAQAGTDPAAPAAAAKPQATETIARRAGAMVNEIDFPGFVSQLVHGTFDAIVDASIRQMESYSSLVSAVAKTVDQFTEENVTYNQARDWLAGRYPGDVAIRLPESGGTEPQLVPRSEDASPVWLADYGLEGETLTPELLEQQVLPQVRSRVGAERQQLLATMVLLGLNRVAVRDGSISAKVMFRAAASDAAAVQYATSTDPQAIANWGERGSLSQGARSTTMVSTVAVNAQNESTVRADLFGEVKLNFVSETLPLDRLADAAKIALVQQHSPAVRPAVPAPAPTPASAPAPAPAASLPPAGGGGG